MGELRFRLWLPLQRNIVPDVTKADVSMTVSTPAGFLYSSAQ